MTTNTETKAAPSDLADRLMSTREAAAALDIAYGTLRNLRGVGEGPAYVRIGRSVKYRRSAVEEYMAGLR